MLLAVILLLWPSISTASPKTEPEITPIERGEIAPFSGQLYPEILAVSTAKNYGKCVIDNAKLTKDLKLLKINMFEQVGILGAEKEALQIKLEIVQKELAPRWYRHPVFVASTTGTLVFVVVMVVKSVPLDWRDWKLRK